MIPGPGAARLEERLKAAGDLHVSLLHRGERRLVAAALAGAFAIHVAVALLPLPEGGAATAVRATRPATRRPVPAQAIVPSLPTIPLRVAAAAPRTPAASATAAGTAAADEETAPSPADRAVSFPPGVFEPVVEPEPEMAPESLPLDAEILLGSPEPPPSGPTSEEAEVVSQPELIQGSRVLPVFPQRARQLGAPGKVVLDVSVLPDGSVGEIAVLRCTPPDLGFCQSAVKAVKRWRYRPGLRNGRAAQFSVTVIVDFEP